MGLLNKLLFPPQDAPAPPPAPVTGSRSRDYGTLKPRIIEYLGTVESAAALEIALVLDLEINSTRRALRVLRKEDAIVCTRKFLRGDNMLPALWAIKK